MPSLCFSYGDMIETSVNYRHEIRFQILSRTRR